MSTQVPRRTLPAPSEPANFEAIIRERDQLRAENQSLRERLSAREVASRDSAALLAEVSRLRLALAGHRHEPDNEPRSAVRPPAEVAPAFRDVGIPVSTPVSAVSDKSALFAPGAIPTGHWTQGPLQENAGLDFGTVSKLSPSELDQLPYGLICLDAQGRVVHYNDTESRLARLPKERVIGRNFFSEVAPCSRVRDFEGEFFELVRDPSTIRVRSFDFVFKFAHSEQHVTIVITPARQRGLYNMALLRRSIVVKER